MPSNIASSVLVNKPDDKVASADAYGTPPGEVTQLADSSIGSLLKQSISIASDQLKGKKLDTDKVVSLSTDALAAGSDTVPLKEGQDTPPGLTVEPVIPTAEEKRLLNGIAGSNLNEYVLTGAVGYMRSLNSDTKQYNTLISDGVAVASLLDSSTKHSATSLSSSIASLTKSSTLTPYINQNATLGLSLAYLDQAIALGIPELLDEVIQYMADKRLAKEKLIESVRSVIMRGDINTLNKILGYVGGAGVLARVPEACALFLSRYKIPQDENRTNLTHNYHYLIEVMNKIDVNWATDDRNGEQHIDLSVFRSASSDAKKVLIATQQGYDRYLDALLVAPTYYTTVIHFLAKRDFPLVIFR